MAQTSKSSNLMISGETFRSDWFRTHLYALLVNVDCLTLRSIGHSYPVF
jgi:hypothetical protein